MSRKLGVSIDTLWQRLNNPTSKELKRETIKQIKELARKGK